MAEMRFIIDYVDQCLRLLCRSARRATDASPVIDYGPKRRLRGERGAVSLEQVLWFVAAGVSVAVIAGIIWAQIMSQASTPINAPSAP